MMESPARAAISGTSHHLIMVRGQRLMDSTKDRQAVCPKVSVAPWRSFASRTNTRPTILSATSTQLPPAPLLRLDLRQRGHRRRQGGLRRIAP
jgi:hypothetical protein